jgi:hypothetical protein
VTIFARLSRIVGGVARWTVPPVEPHRDDLTAVADAAAEDVRAEVEAIDSRIRKAVGLGDWPLVDHLLEQRHGVCPARPIPVPVVPGRVDRSVNEWWENPR